MLKNIAENIYNIDLGSSFHLNASCCAKYLLWADLAVSTILDKMLQNIADALGGEYRKIF